MSENFENELRRALRPVGAIARTAREIQATDLSRRIRLEGAHDELRERVRERLVTVTRQALELIAAFGRAAPRMWIACSTPIASRFAISAEPPTLTNGSGMPVTGAMPIVIPTFTKTWKRSANTIAPATVAQKGSRAVAITRIPLQMSRR
jgi:HAMP domain-containing protein